VSVTWGRGKEKNCWGGGTPQKKILRSAGTENSKSADREARECSQWATTQRSTDTTREMSHFGGFWSKEAQGTKKRLKKDKKEGKTKGRRVKKENVKESNRPHFSKRANRFVQGGGEQGAKRRRWGAWNRGVLSGRFETNAGHGVKGCSIEEGWGLSRNCKSLWHREVRQGL